MGGGKFSNHSKAGSSTTNSCRCEAIEKKLNEAKKKLKKVFAKLDKLKKLAVKKIAQKVTSLPLKAVPILGWAMAAYDVYDVVTTGIDIAEVVEEFNKEAGIVNKLSDKLDACLGNKGEAEKKDTSIWSETKKKKPVKNAFDHYKKHKKEFPEYKNSKEYVEGAKKFLNDPPKGTLTKINARGDILRYNPKCNTFGVLSKDGVPRTMFRPQNGMEYWKMQ